jgi:hypothetical protein
VAYTFLNLLDSAHTVSVFAVRQPSNIIKKIQSYSTVTLFARFLGLSTSQPRNSAMW